VRNLLVLLGIVFFLTACGQKEEEAVAPASEPAATEQSSEEQSTDSATEESSSEESSGESDSKE
jgi:predicted small lipoprotein YifL